MFHPTILLAIAIGGAVGAVARYSVSLAAKHWLGDSFPFGTLIVNVVGCLALGLVAELGTQWEATHPGRIPEWLHRGVAVGLLGALTTFSTFGHETVRHLEQQQYIPALLNVLVSVSVGLTAVAIGIWIGRTIAG